MRITQEVKAFAIEQAERRCECTGDKCRHHLRGARCKRGLRGDQWKVFWRTETGGLTRENIEAWCIECFSNNFETPRETVALLALDIAGHGRLMEEDAWRAITLKSILRDAAARAAREHRGGMVMNRSDDDVLVAFATSVDAVDAARSLSSTFREMAQRLNLATPDLRGAIHCGEVTRWRNGMLVGEATEVARSLPGIADRGQIVLTEPAVAPLGPGIELEPIADGEGEGHRLGRMWALRL